MKNIFSKTAYTLIELIVSLMLVSIVALGIFSINIVLNNNNQDYGQKYLVKSETQATLNQILSQAALAVGSGTEVGNQFVPDQGVVTGLASGSNNTFCIHQNPSGVDTWLCYTFDNTPSDSTYQQITYCNKTYDLVTASDSERGATGSCTTAAQFLGTAFSVAPTYNSATNSFSITIQNCLNDSLSSCSVTGTSTDPANNPEVSVTGSVSPPQQGTG